MLLPHLNPFIEFSLWIAFILGGYLCVLNFSLPVRYYLDRWRKRPPGPHVSPVPIVGSLFVYLSLRVLGEIPFVPVAGWALIAIDTGGVHWMAFGIGLQLVREARKRLAR